MPIPCKSCQTLIDFVESAKKDPTTGKGRRIPVDATARVFIDTRSTEEPQATVVTDDGVVVSGHRLEGRRDFDHATGDIKSGRTSHFATCTNPKAHRKSKR